MARRGCDTGGCCRGDFAICFGLRVLCSAKSHCTGDQWRFRSMDAFQFQFQERKCSKPKCIYYFKQNWENFSRPAAIPYLLCHSLLHVRVIFKQFFHLGNDKVGCLLRTSLQTEYIRWQCAWQWVDTDCVYSKLQICCSLLLSCLLTAQVVKFAYLRRCQPWFNSWAYTKFNKTDPVLNCP